MSGREDHQTDGSDDELVVDAILVLDLGSVEASVGAYLANPSADLRNELLAALERLDQHIDDSDAYESSIIGSGAFGSSTKGAVIGETSSASPAQEVPESVLRAQTVLIKAAKREVAAPTADTLADLRLAAGALSDVRNRELRAR
jgi:hypothetical protein